MSKAAESRFLKVLHDSAIGPNRKRSIEDVALEVYDGADHEATKLGRKLYAQLDTNPDKEYDRFPAIKLPAFIQATGDMASIRHLAHLFNLYVFAPGAIAGCTSSLRDELFKSLRQNTDAVETVFKAQALDSPGGVYIVPCEAEQAEAKIDQSIETLLTIKAAVKAMTKEEL